MAINNYGMPGSYVPPMAGSMAAPTMNSYAPGSYAPPTGDMYNPGGVPYGPPTPGAAPRPSSGPNLLMVAGLAIGGFMLFGPVGAIVGGLIGLFMGGK